MSTKKIEPAILKGPVHMYVGDLTYVVNGGKSYVRKSIWFSKENNGKPQIFATLYRHPTNQEVVLQITAGNSLFQKTLEETIDPVLRRFDDNIARYYKPGDITIVCPEVDAFQCQVCSRFRTALKLWHTVMDAEKAEQVKKIRKIRRKAAK